RERAGAIQGCQRDAFAVVMGAVVLVVTAPAPEYLTQHEFLSPGHSFAPLRALRISAQRRRASCPMLGGYPSRCNAMSHRRRIVAAASRSPWRERRDVRCSLRICSSVIVSAVSFTACPFGR